MPMIVPTGLIPNDTLFAQQWNMTSIHAGGAGRTGWDISTGVNGVVICILDEGCDLSHPDLQYSTPGINLGTMKPDGSPVTMFDDRPHGTCCAGIAAATINNAAGVAGVAGNCMIMPLTRAKWTDAETAAGIMYATDHGANVINMSFGYPPGKYGKKMDPAIQYAYDHYVVMCACTKNENGPILYPATNPLVIACGASDQLDNRKSPTTTDGECWWGSNFGPEISVVAPGVLIPTTDLQGADGYNRNGSAKIDTFRCLAPPYLGGTFKSLTYSTTGDTAGNYFSNFNGTSAATPHVAGLAALLQSEYTLLRFDSDRVRNIIEQTAEKKGPYTYSYHVSHPNGTWNEEMGYGRINVFRALDYADVYIRDSPRDNGRVPFTAGPFWNDSDIVVKNSDDGIFKSEPIVRGRDVYIYVRATNLGPNTARNVNVHVYAAPFAGTEFVFPEDWTASPTHIEPASMISHFDSIDAPGAFFAKTTADAKFKLDKSQVDKLYGWETGSKWHPCLLVSIKGDNDYGTPVGTHSWENNNLAQRNISIVRVDRPDDAASGSSSDTLFPFVTGNRLNEDLYMEIVIDRSTLPEQAVVLLNPFDTDKYFPALENPETFEFHPSTTIQFLDRTRLLLSRSNFKGLMTLEAGSAFEDVGNHEANITIISQQDAEWVSHAGNRLIAIRGDNVTIGVQKQPGELRQMSLTLKIPNDAKLKDQYQINVSQRNTKGQVVGGVSLLIEAQGY